MGGGVAAAAAVDDSPYAGDVTTQVSNVLRCRLLDAMVGINIDNVFK